MDPWPWIRLGQGGNRHPALEPSERRAETAHPSASTATSLRAPWPKNTALLATLPRCPACSSYCQFPALVQHPLISSPPATQTHKKFQAHKTLTTLLHVEDATPKSSKSCHSRHGLPPSYKSWNVTQTPRCVNQQSLRHNTAIQKLVCREQRKISTVGSETTVLQPIRTCTPQCIP
jgi:hypothetical protein